MSPSVTTPSDGAPLGLRPLVAPGAQELFGTKASLKDVAATLRQVNRAQVARLSVALLNALAYDRNSGFGSDQQVLIDWLPEDARTRCAILEEQNRAPTRPFHPLQQLAIVHFAVRYSPTSGGLSVTTDEGRRAWATACIQVNDLIPSSSPPDGASEVDRLTHLFALSVAGWELINTHNASHSLSRLLALMTEAPKQASKYAAACERLKERFRTGLGLEFQWAYDLTAFLIYWWELNAEKIPANPESGVIDLRQWLAGSQVPSEVVESYLRAVATPLDAITDMFDELRAQDNVLETIPFRRKPVLRLDGDRLIPISPSLVAEKGGIDLFWLLTNDPDQAREQRLWTDDFGMLYEAYVQMILAGLDSQALGGRYLADVAWALGKDRTGQIDDIILTDDHLFMFEVKGSLIRQTVKSLASWPELRRELDRKFVRGDDDKRSKGLVQLKRSIEWLNEAKRLGERLGDIDLRNLDGVTPVLVTADRAVRFPGLGQWFNRTMRDMLPAWTRGRLRIDTLVVCGIEDLEALERRAAEGGPSVVAALQQYHAASNEGRIPLWQMYPRPSGPHPRLEKAFNAWIERLRSERILPAS